MRQILASIALAFTFVAVPLAVSVWTPIVDKVKDSVVFLENCTGFVINAEKHYVMTAAHCLPEDESKLLVDGTRAYRMFIDSKKDFMVLRAPAVDKPAMKLATTKPVVGDEVASLGYGFVFDKPMFRVAHVSITGLESDELGSGPFLLLDEVLVPGQSGGPIINDKGEVVAIVQMTIQGFGVGIGRDSEVIKDRVGRYFQQ